MAKKTDLEKRLEEVSDLHAKGILNDEEYAARRAAVMASPGAFAPAKKGGFPIFKVGCLGIVALVVVVIIAVAAAGSGGGDDETTAGDTDGTPQVGTHKGDVHVAFGSNATGVIAPEGNGDKKTKVTILQSVDNAPSTNQFQKPDEGKKYWAVEVTVENVGTAEVSSLDWKLRDSTDNETGQEFVSGVGGEPIEPFYQLTPGGKKTGWMVFEMAVDATPKWLRADPNFLLKNDLYFDFH